MQHGKEESLFSFTLLDSFLYVIFMMHCHLFEKHTKIMEKFIKFYISCQATTTVVSTTETRNTLFTNVVIIILFFKIEMMLTETKER